MPVLRTARIVFDSARRVKEANGTAMDLTGGRALPGTPRSELRSALLGALDREPPWDGYPISYIESCPIGPCRFFLTCVGANTFLTNYDREGEDLVVRFEPLAWSVGFADELNDLVLITDSLHHVAYVNNITAQRLTTAGQQHQAYVSATTLLEDVGLDQTIARQMATQALNGMRLRHEFEGRDGLHDCEITSTPLRYCGQICGVLWVLHETPKTAFHDLQALAALSYRMAAMYQHELRNPLQTVQAAITLACRRQGGCGDLLNIVDRNIRDITEILGEHMLPIGSAPAPTGKLSATVGRAIADALLRHSSHLLSFDHEVPDGEPDIRCHTAAITRAFANLFRNAAQARHDAHVRISYAWDEQTLSCVVEDDGPGFPPEMLAGMLTTHSASTHFGLVLVAATVESHGGAVQLMNAPGGGARVILRFPLSVGAEAEVAATSPPPTSVGTSWWN